MLSCILRAMQNKPTVTLTQDGLDKAKKRQAELEVYREEVLIRLQAAREMGDLSENGAYKAARFELSDTDRELKRLRFITTYGQAAVKQVNGQAGIGNQVTLEKEGGKKLSFTLVSQYEADPKLNKLSVISPYGQAIAGKSVGDKVTVDAPAGKLHFTITDIS